MSAIKVSFKAASARKRDGVPTGPFRLTSGRYNTSKVSMHMLDIIDDYTYVGKLVK